MLLIGGVLTLNKSGKSSDYQRNPESLVQTGVVWHQPEQPNLPSSHFHYKRRRPKTTSLIQSDCSPKEHPLHPPPKNSCPTQSTRPTQSNSLQRKRGRKEIYNQYIKSSLSTLLPCNDSFKTEGREIQKGVPFQLWSYAETEAEEVHEYIAHNSSIGKNVVFFFENRREAQVGNVWDLKANSYIKV